MFLWSTMSVRIIIISIAVMSTAFPIPGTQKDYGRICRSIMECQACLLMPHCYASYGLSFSCQKYPLPSNSDINSTIIIVDHPSCCPTSSAFNYQTCGFGPKSAVENFDHFIMWASVSVGLLVGLIVLVIIICIIVKSCKQKRGTLNVSTAPTTLSTNVPTSTEIIGSLSGVTPATSRMTSATHPPAPTEQTAGKTAEQTKNLSELFKTELQTKASASWKARRDSMRSHPLDQSRV